jgi:glycosyltransferase involved in cell wall biosynthesis
MRLAVEITTCTPLRTGVGYYTEHVVDALLETRGPGDEVVLLSNRPPAPELAERWAPHVHISGPAVRAVWMQSAVPRMLAEARADLGVFPNYAAPLASPCPTLVVVHDLAVLRVPHFFTARKRFLSRPMMNLVVAASPVIATVSEASQRDILALLGVPRERIALLPGAAHPSCRPATRDEVAAARARHGLERPYVLTVGTLEPRKDLPTLLRAFDRLHDQTDQELVVVGGRGWKDRRLVKALEARQTGRRVRWLGYVTESDLAALYTGADLFVFAPTLEGFGLPLLEAMACGTPVLAADVVALREVAGGAARFVPPGDDAAFARAIAQTLHDPGESARLRAAGLRRARQFSWTATAEALWARARAIAPARLAIAGGFERREPEGAAKPPPLPPPPPALTAREWALLATVVYADLFESPLPLRQALRASIGATFDEAEVRRLAAGPALSSLLVLHPEGFLVLAGREHLVDPMPEREALTRALLDRHRATLALLASLPFVRALVISGGVAHKNAGKRPDVDLFVVAAAGRAYTAYSLLVLATKIAGTRRAVCPNYLVDERELAIAYHRDLFTANQLVSALPYAGRSAYEALCGANAAWVRSFFPGFEARESTETLEPGPLQAIAERAIAPAAPALESVLRGFWRFRLRRRAAAAAHADVVLSDGILKLHLSDYRRLVLERFFVRLQGLRAPLGSEARTRRPDVDPVGT